MKQVLQSLRTGATDVVDVPCPTVKSGSVLIRTRCSLVSAGTERMLLSFGKASLLSKARQQPERVKQAMQKVRTDGLLPTLEAIRSRLDRPTPMGYCNVGTVLEVGSSVGEFQAGDRVVSNGNHAEVVAVPKTLCARIPDGVSDQDASFAVLGAIALQGVRLAQPTIGESFAVMGLGLVGLLAVQILQANGCRVIGLDFNRQRLEMARAFGAETVDLGLSSDPVAAAVKFSRGAGVDGVLVATATDSQDPMRQAARMCRKRGRVILVGVAGLELNRSDFFEKELEFRVSCSYGPGRYDPTYEQRGQDYPLPFVRWTEQRNFEAVLDLLAARKLSVAPLLSHRFPLERAAEAYALLLSREPSLGVLLKYPTACEVPDATLRQRTIILPTPAPTRNPKTAAPTGSSWLTRIPLFGPMLSFVSPSTETESTAARSLAVGVLGAGNFSTRTLLPALKSGGARLVSLASESGLSAVPSGRTFGFEEATSDTQRVLTNPDIQAVVIATRHDTHADFVCRALAAGKHVFVEKPLAIDERQLAQVEQAQAACEASGCKTLVMVGFNRRFAPHIATIQSLLRTVDAPRSFTMMVNAGAIPAEHWTQSASEGGGRLIGEACHFIDLLRFLAGAPIETIRTTTLKDDGRHAGCPDTASISLTFENGSAGTVHYLANGHRAISKERLEVFCAGRVLQLDNFRTLRGYGWPKFQKQSLWQQDKGHVAGMHRFLDAARHGLPAPIAWDEILETSRASLAAGRSALTGETIELTSRPQGKSNGATEMARRAA